jgi:hypothetical protein
MLQRNLPLPIGRLKMASGTYEKQALREINAMVDALVGGVPPRWDILQAIKGRRITPMFALSLYKQNRLEEIPCADVLPPLAATWEAWVADKAYSPEYIASIKSTLRGLLRQGTEPTLQELPTLLERYRAECKARGKPVQFNRAKAHVQAFVRDTLKRRHEMYDDVTDVAMLPVAGKTVKRPQKPDRLAVILGLLPLTHRRMAWEMAVTGMGPKEYWGSWTQVELPVPHVHIEGTKRKSRVRNVPLWAGPLQGPRCTRDTFEGSWTRCINPEMDEPVLTIYDLRRSFAVWLAEAGIPMWRQPIYMGHAAAGQTAKYQESELMQWLEEDADRLYSYAGLVVQNVLGVAA